VRLASLAISERLAIDGGSVEVKLPQVSVSEISGNGVGPEQKLANTAKKERFREMGHGTFLVRVD
jgi:hypothetical protein